MWGRWEGLDRICNPISKDHFLEKRKLFPDTYIPEYSSQIISKDFSFYECFENLFATSLVQFGK